MLVVRCNDESYSYDIHSLVKAFYPAQDVRVITDDTDIHSDSDLPEFFIYADNDDIKIEVFAPEGKQSYRSEGEAGFSDDRAAYKSELKRCLYRALSQSSGHELPWGTLTGIRPTKLAMNCMDRGLDTDGTVDHMKDFYLCSDEKARLAVDIAIRERGILKEISDTAVSICSKEDGNTSIAESAAKRDMYDVLADGYSLYIGIPFCPSTCLYCSFMSYPIAAYKDVLGTYMNALKREIDYVAADFADRRLDSIYIGGGTPTTLDADMLRELIGYVREKTDTTHIREFTVEAGRADSIDEGKLVVLKEMGVDRISVNPQTLNEQTLKLIGRRATAAQTVEAYKLARDIGFDNINMDIILGLPGESIQDVKATLEGIEKLRPDDLTVHALAVKRGSKLAEMMLEGKSTNDKGVMLRNTGLDYDTAMRLTQDSADRMGLKPYYLYRQKNISGNLENTGYAAEGKAGIYNILMMEEVQDIVALGAGTVSKHVYRGDMAGRIERCDTHKDLKLYLQDIDMMIDRKRRLFGEQ